MKRPSTSLAIALMTSALLAFPLAASTGEETPGLRLPSLKGGEEDLARHRGSIVVLNFWATWCAPCREELPLFVEIQEAYGARGVQVIAASADEAGAADQVSRFARRHHLSFPVWLGATTQDMERFGVGPALPATVILDRDGAVAARLPGVVAEDDLRRRLDWLLSDRSAAPPGPASEKHEPEPEHEHEHEHGEHPEAEHQHGGVGVEGASLVPS